MDHSPFSPKFFCYQNDSERPKTAQIRSKLEQSAVLWHSSLTQKCRNKLERVQKSALRVILGSRYTNYDDALKELNLQTLDERRQSLCVKFAKKCLETKKFKNWFPLNRKMHQMKKSDSEKYLVTKSFTERHRRSALPSMRRILNEKEKKKQKVIKQISSTSVPVNNGLV